jgi:hypothetical protein
VEGSPLGGEDDGKKNNRHQPSRRAVLAKASIVGTAAALLQLDPVRNIARAAEEASNLASTLFNPDGSVREGVKSEAKFRTVSISWDDAQDGSFASSVDGENVGSTRSGHAVRLSYRLPEKWAAGEQPDGDELYFDRTEGVNAKACRRITVFRASGGNVSESRLERATRVGIANALGVPTDLSVLESADLVSGRVVAREGQRYYEFDLAVAPKTCEQSKEDLGLGFCPYESIYLLSSTVLDGHLYVMVVESDKTEWKRANSDLKLVRDSFRVVSNDAGV